MIEEQDPAIGKPDLIDKLDPNVFRVSGFFSKNYFPWISFLIDEEISVNVLIVLVLDVIYAY